MFDDQPNNPNLPPSNLPTEPVDMFAETEKNNAESFSAPEQQPNALSAGMLKKKEEDISSPLNSGDSFNNAAPMYAMKEPILGKIILSVVFVVILGGLGFGGWWVYANYFGQSDDKDVGVNTNQNNVATNTITDYTLPIPVEDNANVIVASPTTPTDVELDRDINNDIILFGEPIDSDKDGLDDVREREIGTDPFIADTDGDGLIDGDEVIIWKTDPLNPDTDGDGHEDGKEVRNGYSPLGPGKLFSPVSPDTPTSSTATKN